jgi:hypothetical protein
MTAKFNREKEGEKSLLLTLVPVAQQARAVSRKRGGMPAETFVRIWKFIARSNLCAPRLREAATTLCAMR